MKEQKAEKMTRLKLMRYIEDMFPVWGLLVDCGRDCSQSVFDSLPQ